MKIDFNYVNTLEDIMRYGHDYEDPNRKGVMRKEMECVVLKHLVQDGFPIVTARKTFFKGAIGELILFLRGSTDIRDYWNYGIRFWDKDFKRFQKMTDEEFEVVYEERGSKEFPDTTYSMGKIYGHQYKKQHHIFDNFKENPYRSDLVVDSWNVDELSEMALIPCHYAFQIIGSDNGFMIAWNQRSTDFMLGTPINVQFYFAMGMLLQAWSGHKFNGVVGYLNKVHLYDNQFALADKMIRMPTDLYKENVRVALRVHQDLKKLSFSEFIKKVEPTVFEMENYNYVLDEKVPMLTYTDKNEK